MDNLNSYKNYTPKLTKAEIIDDLVEHIKSQGGRALEGPLSKTCIYLTADGKTCGHSFTLLKRIRQKIASTSDNYGGSTQVIQKYGDEAHKVKYRGHSPSFWAEVQILHDTSIHWDAHFNLTGEALSFINSQMHIPYPTK